MPMRLPGPMREIIDLLSSPPFSRHSPAPTTIRKFEDPFMSSPLPPSPSAMFSAFAERAKAAVIVREVQESKEKEKASIWDIPDDPREVELPPPPPPPPPPLPAPATKNKRDPKTTAPAKIPRARKVTEKSKVEKKAPLGNGKIKARVIKSSLEAVTKSKYFPEKQQPKGREHPPDVLTALNLSSENTALAPKSPNQGPHPKPPLHVTRRQWTPVKNTVLLSSSSPSLANGELRMTKVAAFSNMIHAMRYSTEPPEKSQEVSVSLENRVENVLIRKRAIEMISPPNSAATTGPPILKLKAPKQKRKTITDQATASYRTATNSPLLQNCLKHQTSLITKDRNPRKPPSRKPGSPAKKKHKSGTETIILLSPTGAQKRFDSQEFVFGTCSQLERTPEDEAGPACDSQPEFDNQNDNYYDESLPSSTSIARRGFLKTLAKDRKGGSLFKEDSWEMKNRLVAGYDVSAAGMQEQPARQRESQPSKFQGTSGMLWDAAAQDPDGGVLDVEFLDMTGSDNGDSGYLESNSTRLKENSDLLRGGTTAMETAAIGRLATQNDAEESCQSIGREPQIAEVTAAARENDPFQTTRGPRNSSQAIRFEPTSALLLVTPHTTNPVPARVTGDSSRSISSSATAPSVAPVERQPNPPNPVLNSVALKSKKSKQPKPAPVMPDFQSYQVTMLKAEIAKFGFKDMKTKDRMVSCLERCWEAQNKAATVTAQSAAQPEANDSRSVANTTELPQRVMNKEETVSALHSQDNLALLASKKPHASTKQKKTGKEKAISKSPKHKAAPKRRARSPKVVAQSENVNFGTLGFTDLSAEPSSPKRNYTPKVSTRKASAPPSPKSVAFNTTQRHYRISKVVRESSGCTGSKFSFYHSILMYDPIILEDMTSWLNLTFQNEKVDVEAVKAWCEANGVCCVRSESLRTKRRKR